MHPEDSLKKRKKKVDDSFQEFLKEEFEDPEHSDVMIEKQSKPDEKDPKKRPHT
jgi:hypothetical protein